MLSLRIVVLPATSADSTPASPTRRSMSERMLSGETLSTATLALLATRHLGVEHHGMTRVLLNDGEQSGIEEADLEEDEERQRAVDLVRERVEHGRCEVEPEAKLDERLHGY